MLKIKLYIHLKKLIVSVILGSSILGLISCDRPHCKTENIIFTAHPPESKVYKDELVRQLKTVDPSQLSYWLQKYEIHDEKEALSFYIQGGGLCAVLYLTMNRWEKLELLRAKKGISYRGAEFTNLKFEIVTDSLSTEFIYKTFDRTVD